MGGLTEGTEGTEEFAKVSKISSIKYREDSMQHILECGQAYVLVPPKA
jgi:hypothetical protein